MIECDHSDVLDYQFRVNQKQIQLNTSFYSDALILEISHFYCATERLH